MAAKRKKHKPVSYVFDCEMIPVPPGTKSKARLLRGSEWEIPGILAEILAMGLQRIAALGQSGNAKRCAVEADHLSNLPALLAEFDPDVLDHYWNVQRAAFIKRSLRKDAAAFKPMWKALGEVFKARKKGNHCRHRMTPCNPRRLAQWVSRSLPARHRGSRHVALPRLAAAARFRRRGFRASAAGAARQEGQDQDHPGRRLSRQQAGKGRRLG